MHLPFNPNTIWKDRRTILTRVNTILRRNRNFNPRSHPEMPLTIMGLVIDYYDGSTRRLLETKAKLTTRQSPPSLVQYYTYGVTEEHNYLDSALRSSTYGEVFFFIQEEYVIVNHDLGAADDYVVDGPGFIPYKSQYLHHTAFSEHSIACAFGYSGVSKGFMFSGKQHYGRSAIVEGPKTIAQMFLFLYYTRLKFDKGLDVAFEVTGKFTAYFFKRDYSALVQYGSGRKLLSISLGWNALRLIAVLALHLLHTQYEYHIFKGQYYALLKYNLKGSAHTLPNGASEICPNRKSLCNILPQHVPDHDQDDL
ncbi:hypothetical protein Cgig2_005342 [Carnegiea gigantea]|uniref:Uncharacterized protein n=1 Tax=Carnegiea gigantea TaxID=171969 RepID=A0A9Q1K5F2_9CARY|nr:hypothetical protein Cgig2_005342 [Carnegiea gigantea]